MNKTTTTVLMAAGLIFLAGCKTEVMRDRHFLGDPPQDDPKTRKIQRKDQIVAPVKDNDLGPAPIAKSGYTPMKGTYNNEGIEDETLCRRAPRRSGSRARSSAAAAAGSVYIVKPGDTLGRIAYRHKVSVKALRQANNRTPEQDRFLRAGTKLVIPGAKCTAPAGKKGQKAAPVRRSGKNTPKLNADGTYTMVKGDSIPKVARKFGIRARALQRANNLTDEETTRLQVGHKLVIPAADNTAAAAPRKKARKAAAAPAAPKKAESAAPQLPPPPVSADNGAAPQLPPPPVSADNGVAVLPPPAPAAAPAPAAPAPAADGTDFVSVAGCNTIEEFAAKYNTTPAEVVRLNPQVDPKAPMSTHTMLYVPRTAK